MKNFMNKDFLLKTKTAQRLYHEVAAHQPIFDYHCHLIPKEIADNKRFTDLAEVWLGGDHYKWRAMRSNGVDEKYITGAGSPYEKYMAWAETVPNAIGNPLYHWTHLELQRYFGVYESFDPDSAPAIWDTTKKALAEDPELSVHGIFKKFSVFAVGTTDDPADDLAWHKKYVDSGQSETKVLPSFRPDKAFQITAPHFRDYMQKLGAAAGIRIESITDLLEALRKRIDFFDSMGCRSSDHALEFAPFALDPEGKKGSSWETYAGKALTAVLNGETISEHAAESFTTFILRFLAAEYAKKGWAMQLHLAAIRNNNSRQLKALGPDTGFDGVHDHAQADKLASLLDLMDSENALPKTILYSLNPKDYYVLGTLMGCFQGGAIPGKIQLGSAWWFCDHYDGMTEQLRTLGSLGLLPRFVGMLTDSRSFLSYPRHEYFRRILCGILGTWAEDGEIPNSPRLLDRIVADISFGNAKRYFLG